MKIVRAPWTDEQVKALLKRQEREDCHPYTCICRNILIPTHEGWICSKCSYRQDWAHDFDTNI